MLIFYLTSIDVNSEISINQPAYRIAPLSPVELSQCDQIFEPKVGQFGQEWCKRCQIR